MNKKATTTITKAATTTKRRGRPVGALNKDPFIRIRVSDIIQTVGNECLIPVRTSWVKEVFDKETESQFASNTLTQEFMAEVTNLATECAIRGDGKNKNPFDSQNHPTAHAIWQNAWLKETNK